jgi:hypothetical protein
MCSSSDEEEEEESNDEEDNQSLTLPHPVLEGKPNASYVRVRIKNSRTQRLHN